MNQLKNRNREAPSFANINLLGRCNVDCFFCLGKDIEDELGENNQLNTSFDYWKNFFLFLDTCRDAGIEKIYITGQNTDSLCYRYLEHLIKYLQPHDFRVGLRTNGYLALNRMEIINLCDLSVGYSIHSLSSVTNKMIMCRSDIPDWNSIIPATRNPRVSIVINRCNAHEFFDIVRYVARFPNVRYIQARRVSTDTRMNELAVDVEAYEKIYTQVSREHPLVNRLWGDAEVYNLFDKPVCFWRTVRTSVNSYNFFTDGTVSRDYFVVEGYLKNRSNPNACPESSMLRWGEHLLSAKS